MDNYSKPGMTQEQLQNIRESYGLDGNIAEQYFRWAGSVIHGDLGISLKNKRPVTEIIGERLPATLILMGTAFAISLIFAIPLGLWAGLKKNKMPDNIIGFLTYVGISIPPFWLSMVFNYYFFFEITNSSE